MQPSTPIHYNAFCSHYPARSNVLVNKVQIGSPFDPASGQKASSIKEYDAIWDTGATGSVITQAVVDNCSLKPTGMTMCHGVHGEAMVETYLVSLILPGDVVIPSITVTKGQFIGGDVLIGMDIIGSGDFAVTNAGKTIFTFRCPSVGVIDFTKDLQAAVLREQAKTSGVTQNSPCPCGSGQKFKRCCGKK